MTNRRKPDWTTPVLLTLSLHLLAFTLFVNHRLFSLLEQPRVGGMTLQISALSGEEPEDEQQDGDPGAAAQGPADPAPAPASVAEMLRADAVEPLPIPAREPQPKADETPTPVQPDRMGNMSLAERLAMLRPAGGSAGGESGFVAGGGSHSLRGQGRRGEGLRRHGGSGETEDAVEMGLAWLASVQDIDGRWDSDGYMSHYLHSADQYQRAAEGVGMMRNDVGVSALCLLAFTGAGCVPDSGRYAATVRKARDWLLAQQRPEDGGFGLERDSTRPDMYGHALACLGLCDLYLQSADQKLRSPLQRAFNYLLEMQGPGGGWDYAPRWPSRAAAFTHTDRNDLSISGWAILALSAAREAGFGIPEDNLRRLAGFLKTATLADGDAIYANTGTRAGARGLAMLAVSNVSRRLLGEPAESAIQQRQRQRLAAQPPDWSKAGDLTSCNEYAWYYGTLAMLLGRDAEGGENRWREWNGALKKTLLGNQCRSGPRKGSFDPVGYWARNGGGRLYMTALCVLNLEIYYRYEPEYLRVRAAELAGLWD